MDGDGSPLRLSIERWAADEQVTGPAAKAVAESAACFKLGAYRAGLLFAYLAWALVIRRRLVGARAPTGFVAGRWAALQTQLLDEAEWDAAVFQATQQAVPPIFLVPADLRRQVEYWKDRRNDCAHFKDNEITSAHVEAFYSFFLSNIGRFVPNGSAEALIDRLLIHFDPNMTPPGADIGPIATDVAGAVAAADLPAFFALVEARLVHVLGMNVPNVSTFYCSVLATAHPTVVPALVAHLGDGARDALLRHVLRTRPQLTVLFAGNAVLTRRLWRQVLFVHGGRDLAILATMLRSNMIPAVEIQEAITKAIKSASSEIPSAGDLHVLSANGYELCLVGHAFTERAVNSFDWGNANAALVSWYVATYPITDVIARTLCSVFSGPPYPFTAHTSLAAMFQANPPKRAELAQLAAVAGVTVPAAFQ